MVPVLQQIKEYFETRIKLLKYESIETGTAIAADIILDVVIAFFLIIGFLFLSIALALFLSNLLKSFWAGFGIVTLIYIMFVFLGHLIKPSLQNTFIRTLIMKTFKERKK